MPGSAATHASQSSHGSRKAKTALYHVVAKQSIIDEDLFGEPNSVKTRGQMLEDKWRNKDGKSYEVVVNEKKANDKFRVPQKEVVKIVTKDLIRTLTVPNGADHQPVVLTRGEIDRIRAKASVLSKGEREELEQEIKNRHELEEQAHLARRMQMRELDKNRREQAQLSDLELEAQERAEHLLQRANEQRAEQEDEIKRLNELILNAKIQAIRDAQLLEKEQIRTEMEHEERRLDQMMEVERQNSLKVAEEIEKKRKEERILGAAKIMEQMQENEQERLLDLEKKDQENMAMQKYLQSMMQEDLEKLHRKWEKQKEMREQLKMANDEIMRRKEVVQLQEKVLEERVMAFQREKADREAAYEKEQERVRIEKEKEVARLRAMQERARDEQAERDAVRARREQERLEREWRRKEIEEAQHKTEVEDEMIEARRLQQQEKEHYLALQAQRDRADFERVLRAQKQIIEKEKDDEEGAHRRQLVHATELRRQICEKEQDRIAVRQQFFEEGIKLDEEARQRRMRLDAVKERKLKELRQAGVPKKYLAEVERKVKDTNPLRV